MAHAPPNIRRPSAAWSRLKGPPQDPLEIMGLPSKGDNRLLDHKTQESFFATIVERYMKFCADHGHGRSLDQAFASLALSNEAAAVRSKEGLETITPETQGSSGELSIIMMAMRKLREAVVASGRTDVFAQRAYVFIIRAAILTKKTESYYPALLHLLTVIHAATPLPPPEEREFVAYYILDLACRLRDFRSAYRTRLVYGLKDWHVDGVLDALIHDNWYAFWKLRRAVDGYQKRLLDWAEEDVRMHALKCVGRSYMGSSKAYIERCADREWVQLKAQNRLGWESDGENAVIRKPKQKTNASK